MGISTATIAGIAAGVLIVFGLKTMFYIFYCVPKVQEMDSSHRSISLKEQQRQNDKIIESYPIMLVSLSGSTATVTGISNVDDAVATVDNVLDVLTTSAAKRICESVCRESCDEFKLVCADTDTLIGSYPLPGGYLAVDRLEKASPNHGWCNCCSRDGPTDMNVQLIADPRSTS
jgi:hypothetical protein